MGSNPSPEIGGSFVGEEHKRIRPSLRASRNASSMLSVVPASDVASRCSMNYVSDENGFFGWEYAEAFRTLTKRGGQSVEARPWCRLVVCCQLSFDLTSASKSANTSIGA